MLGLDVEDVADEEFIKNEEASGVPGSSGGSYSGP